MVLPPPRVLSLVWRFCALTVKPTVKSCRFASRNATSWTDRGKRVSDRRPTQILDRLDEEPEIEDVEEKLQALHDEERRRQKAVRYQKIRRRMTPSGPPERKLSWDAMEQIRYLKNEQPEEWTVERLAEGFSVTPDIIFRVLRSKFTPTPERKAKQDAKAQARLRQKALSSGREAEHSRPQLPGPSTAAMLPSGNSTGALVTVASQITTPKGEGRRALVAHTASPAPLASLSSQVSVPPVVFSKHPSIISRSAEEDGIAGDDAFEKGGEKAAEEETWDGRIFSEEELEEVMLAVKTSPVVQVGKEFFDAEGTLLYRI
ncbi:neugrin [Lampris incognitus]|uniref:neugrin n=1 Tax=Lampris incognitus TaxID=2546036 RepID=UPI0024B5363E|nr:neugrin [Lampris incognitus]